MARHVALLRAINVGSSALVPMADLRLLFNDLGFPGARTLLNSGNVVFDGGKRATAATETLLEVGADSQLGVKTDFFVRTASEWRAAIDNNPFPDMARNDPGHLVLMIMKKAPTADAVAALRAAIKGREEVAIAGGREAYVTYPDGIGRSKLAVTLIEKHLGSRGTGRNWNTVLKLAALVEE